MGHCAEYRKLIAAYVDGTAAPEESAALRGHMASCEACASETRELARVRMLVSGLPEVRPSPALRASLAARLRAQPRAGWFAHWFGGLTFAQLRAPAALALVLVLCIAVGLVVIHSTQHAGGPALPVTGSLQASTIPAKGTPAAPADEYLTSCALTHQAFTQDQAFGRAETVQLAAYEASP
jgi:anti-sigma factor RsiW